MAAVKSLKSILATLKYGARKNPGVTYKRTLRHGLTVYMKVDEGFIWIGGSRAGKWPSDDEMITVLRDASAPSDGSQREQWKRRATEGHNPIRFVWAKWLMPAELFEVPQVAGRTPVYE